MTEQRWIWAAGLATTAADGTVLDTWFPALETGRAPEVPDTSALDAQAGGDERREVTIDVVVVEIDLDAPPQATSDAYLRLHALSHLLVAPNEVNLTGIFTVDGNRLPGAVPLAQLDKAMDQAATGKR